MQQYVGPQGSYELSLPPGWEVRYDEEGIPEFCDPRKLLGQLRVKSYLLKGPSAATLDSHDFLKESHRKMPGSEWVRLGGVDAIHSVERSDSTETHHWVVAEGPHVLLATYSAPRERASSREGSDELTAVSTILESLRFR